MRKASEDWVGHKFDKLEIIEFVGIKKFKVGRSAFFLFRCECGNVFEAQKSNVIGKRKDCGCSKPKYYSQNFGASKSPIYKTWSHMRDRCYNKGSVDYKNYGGRGIQICDRWLLGDGTRTGFECFVGDMGERPEGSTIERVDVNGNYEPNNCIWIPRGRQARNRRNVVNYDLDGQKKNLNEIAIEYNVDYWKLRYKVLKGAEPKEAIRELQNE